MATDTTMVIKTTSATKALIQRAADRLGLSVNSFVIMVAKNAAGSDEITVKNTDDTDLAAIEHAKKYNSSHRATSTWDEIKAQTTWQTTPI
jgi:antitoxin component of RelBE/YafQ-DinJ toxin-antitoxin module